MIGTSMPRIPPWLFRQANSHSPNLAALLPACRDLQSARQELRWITDHVNSGFRSSGRRDLLAKLCLRRGRGVPLQYVLGSQPFGPLDIKCRPGVLVPRSETEAHVYHLTRLLKSESSLGRGLVDDSKELRIIDFCTGSGCIALLLFHLLHRHVAKLDVKGVDISPKALHLARENIVRNVQNGYIYASSDDKSLDILGGDLFRNEDMAALAQSPCDVIVSNPPYVSRSAWDGGHGKLGYSVRKYEPRLALVPAPDVPLAPGWRHEDAFYARLLDICLYLKPRILLVELGDEKQAVRVLEGLYHHSLAEIALPEVWRDWPDLMPQADEATEVTCFFGESEQTRVPIIGAGNVRCIFIRLDWKEKGEH